MKTLVIFDSLYGNTQKIAESISNTLSGKLKSVSEVDDRDLMDINLLVVGSPVHGGRPTPLIEQFIEELPESSLQNVKVAAFDTRFEPADHGVGIRILLSVLRYAAERINKKLIEKGGISVIQPMGFIVDDKEGPLKKGEIERSADWAKKIKNELGKK